MGNSSTSKLFTSIRENSKNTISAPTNSNKPERIAAKFQSICSYIKSNTSNSSNPCCSSRTANQKIDSDSFFNQSEVLDMDYRNTRELMNDYKKGFFDKNLSDMINKILPTIRSVIMKNNQENPTDIATLQQIAKNESLWENLLFTLTDKIEMSDQLGPSIIAIFVEETLLPTKEQIESLTARLTTNEKSMSESSQRNMLVVLSCLSEKIAGTGLASILNENTVDFTLECLTFPDSSDSLPRNECSQNKLDLVLFALVALEKFAMSAPSKMMIMSKLGQIKNPIVPLVEWRAETNCVKHQIGFLAEYLLDNIFTPDDHVYGYLKLDSLKSVNVRLNDHDTSENLKISPNGFEARNDTLTFESVRSTYQVDQGIWFYEVTLLTNGIMQIGFATKSASFLNDQGFGIGDDCYSVGYDGCRNLIWYNATFQEIKYQPAWQAGDVIGFLLDMDNKKICFYHNGDLVTPFHTDIFTKVSNGVFPAASFMSFQHVVFNFGREPFKYPPKLCNPSNFNDFGILSDDSKFVLPMRKKLEIVRLVKVKDDACSLCCENEANTVLIPCKHDGFCDTCIRRLVNCPICRTTFAEYELLKS